MDVLENEMESAKQVSGFANCVLIGSCDKRIALERNFGDCDCFSDDDDDDGVTAAADRRKVVEPVLRPRPTNEIRGFKMPKMSWRARTGSSYVTIIIWNLLLGILCFGRIHLRSSWIMFYVCSCYIYDQMKQKWSPVEKDTFFKLNPFKLNGQQDIFLLLSYLRIKNFTQHEYEHD